MNEQFDDPKQSQYSDSRELRSVEDVLREQGYSPTVIENYNKLTIKDVRLAELYRLANTGTFRPPGRRQPASQVYLNPLQAKVDRKGRVWVDILMERKKGVTLRQIKKILKVQGHMGRFVSGIVLADRLPELIEMTIRLQTARPVTPTLSTSVPAIQADKATLSQNFPPNVGQEEIDGRNVIIGIVDTGCDFRHPNFMKDKKTRLLYLWDQNGKGNPKPSHFGYGVEYNQARINQALGTSDPYADLKYAPSDTRVGRHGTHVMDIAAGNSPNFPGVAPGADLIFVHLGKPTNPTQDELGTLGSSKNLVDAVKYIFDKADQLGKPTVINLSVGANGGSHDGTSLVEAIFDQLLIEKPGRAIVIAAGNSYRDDIHVSGIVKPGGSQVIEWFIESNAHQNWDLRQELEIWYDQQIALNVEIFEPGGFAVGQCKLGETKSTSEPGVSIQPVIINHLPPDLEPGEDENHINVFLDNRNPKIQAGIWRFTLTQDPGHVTDNQNVNFHAWVERNDEYQSHFANNSQPDYTINTIANGRWPIVVGSYFCDAPNSPISSFSSAGPSRNKNNRQKPELSAPGENIFAARATFWGINNGIVNSGTSMAAPHVTGVIALMFQAARDRNTPSKILGAQEIRNILTATCDKNPPDGGAHHPRYGSGRVNALKAINAVIS